MHIKCGKGLGIRGVGKETARMMLGKLPSRRMTCNRDTASVLPTTSSMSLGLYFSTCREAEVLSINQE